MIISICKAGYNQTIDFAASELYRYLKIIDGNLNIDVRSYLTYDKNIKNVLWLVCDNTSQLEDNIKIDLVKGCGIISGSNPRSVLFAVYRFLYELGCRFPSPEEKSEIIPKLNLSYENFNISINESASYRHRSICIEGSVNYENVANMIKWLPKVYLNGYFFQFKIPYCFFERWYVPNGYQLNEDDVVHMHANLIKDIELRGLNYHATGHGWTCDPIGITEGTSGWVVVDNIKNPEVVKFLAKVDGERKLWGGVPLNTNLCYSNPEVRTRIAKSITQYCIDNSAVNYLHFWLADGSNNHCECDNCKNTKPSDYYVMMLNEIDEYMTAAEIQTKVVFLIYVDLLWEPEKEKIKNPDRFVLMFAPITRTYTNAFSTDVDINDIELAVYDRNKLKMPSNVNENIARLKLWQKQFDGDSFDFDYHIMWDHYKDPGYYRCSEIIHSDMKNLSNIGLCGMVSCQAQRVGFPNWLPLFTMAKTLWNKNLTFDEISNEYFTAEYGPEGSTVLNYLKKLSEYFTPPYIRSEIPRVDEETAKKYKMIPQIIDEMLPEIKLHEGEEAWGKLLYHAELCKISARGLYLRSIDDKEGAAKAADEFCSYIERIQNKFDSSLDGWLMRHVLGHFIRS